MHLIVPGRESEWEDIYYIAWMDMFMGGIRGLQYFSPDNGGVWGQAHVLASYVIFQVVREADPTILNFEFTTRKDPLDGTEKDYFYLDVDRSKLRTVAYEGIKKFLAKLHIYKSMGDFDEAKKMFDGYSAVDETMLRVRDIVIKNKVPRRINLQPNVLLEAGKTDPQYRGYDESFEGVIQSYVDRYPDAFLTDVYKEWVKDVHIMRRID